MVDCGKSDKVMKIGGKVDKAIISVGLSTFLLIFIIYIYIYIYLCVCVCVCVCCLIKFKLIESLTFEF